MTRLFIVAAAAALCACASGEDPGYSALREPAQTDGDAAYQQCLRDSQAVAMAWEAIEEMCREKSGAKDPLAADEK